MSEGIGPRPEGGYPVPERPTYPGPTRERWLWTGLVVGLGLLIFGLLVFGFSGATRAPQPMEVTDVLAAPSGPAAQYGSAEIQVVGWYVELAIPCASTPAIEGAGVAWLAFDCPLRVLLPTQPSGSLSETVLLRDGVRLAAPNGEPFPPATSPGQGTAGLEELVFTGHFNDSDAEACPSDLIDRCRNTLVVSSYTGLIR